MNIDDFKAHLLKQAAELNQVTEETAYDAGFSAAKNGPDDSNCHFRFFSAQQLTDAWQRGYNAGKNDGSKAAG